ncbi:MAG: zinc ribbon domain-containing protein [Lachnospiraceae bacterium]|nr:zinc ribbon domain-containing protein [Lachnospiraceae bacterium]
MQIKCSYCGNFIEESDEKCPYCGAPNEGIKRAANGTPRTIEELRAFAEEKKLPLDKFGFHIGEDYRGPKAFGIYKNEATGKFIVYKNKSDGSRAVRYEGNDEAYAVNEIYQKLKEQVTDYKNYRLQKGKSATPPSGTRRKSKKSDKTGLIILLIVLAIYFGGSLITQKSHTYNQSYYTYQGTPYMYDDYTHDWYQYDDVSGTYEYTEAPEELQNNADDYYEYSEEYTRETTDSDWDDDDDYDWSWSDDDTSGWDSDWGGGDWDSDW